MFYYIMWKYGICSTVSKKLSAAYKIDLIPNARKNKQLECDVRAAQKVCVIVCLFVCKAADYKAKIIKYVCLSDCVIVFMHIYTATYRMSAASVCVHSV